MTKSGRSFLFRLLCSVIVLFSVRASLAARANSEGNSDSRAVQMLTWQWHFSTADGQGRPIDVYTEFSANGHYRQVIYTPYSPMREAQYSGTYSARLEGPERVHVRMVQNFAAPSQVCTPTGACRSVPIDMSPREDTYLFQRDGSFLEGNSTAPRRREPIPAQFLQPLSARIMLQNPPPMNSAPSTGRSGYPTSPSSPGTAAPVHRGYTPAPGNSGTCNDLQQNRICTINGGHIVVQHGCQVCIGPN